MDPKERILQKAHDLFHRYGLRSVSMDDIAAQVGISKKTIYQYFTDKEELVSAVFLTTVEQNKACCLDDRTRAENALHEIFLAFDRVQEMFGQMNPFILYDMEKYHPKTFKKFQEFKGTFLFDLAKSNLEAGKKQGLYREEIDVDVAARYRLFSIMLSFNPEVFPGMINDRVHIEQQMLDIFIYGISTPKGHKLIEKYKTQRIKNK